MKDVATLSDEDRNIIFTNTAEKLSLTPAIVEKDFWVCWTLDYLFHKSPQELECVALAKEIETKK